MGCKAQKGGELHSVDPQITRIISMMRVKVGASFAIATGGVLTLLIVVPPNGGLVWQSLTTVRGFL